MKNILLILVGGTICTALQENNILSVNEKAGALIKSNFEQSDSPFAKEMCIDLTENMLILSENMTVDQWNRITEVYVKYTSAKKYDGVIFAHGTDTLAYTASLFSMLLSKTDIPVFFVSSQKRLDAEGANGNQNFKYAADLIGYGVTPNVYVTYQNPSDGRMYLHLASGTEQCKNYSDDFYSCGMLDITDICAQNKEKFLSRIEEMYPPEKRKAFLDIYKCPKLQECVLLLHPYVGIRYDAYDYSRFRAVLHTTFHSGTACAAENSPNSVFHMIQRCAGAETAVDAYISPSKTDGEIYETVQKIADCNIKFLYGMTTETAYTKLLIAYSCFDNAKDRETFIQTECNFEFAEK